MAEDTGNSSVSISGGNSDIETPFTPKSRIQRSPLENPVPAKKQRSFSVSDPSTTSQLDDLQSFLATDFDVRDGIRRVIMLVSQSTLQINAKLDNVVKEIAELKTWRAAAENQLVQLNERQEDLSCEMVGANEHILQLQDLIEAQRAEIKSLTSDVDALENRQRRENIIFYNVPFVNVTESWNECKQVIIDLCRNIGLPEVNIDRAHRIGRNSSSRSAPIVARIPSSEDRNILLAKWRDLKEQSIGISEDFSKTLRMKRKFLNSERKRLLADGKIAKIRFDKLILNDESYVCNDSCSELIKLTKKNL